MGEPAVGTVAEPLARTAARERVARERGTGYRILRRGYHFLRDTVFYDTLMYPYGAWRYRQLQGTARRSQSHTYTCFYRAPPQLEVLCGPVIEYLQAGDGLGCLRINVFAASTGAEAYTLASMLMTRHPELKFEIYASDLHDETVARGLSARYRAHEVFHNSDITDEFVLRTFDREGDDFVVKPTIRARVHFSRANLLDPNLQAQFDMADIVMAQNVLFHLDPTDAVMAFNNVTQFLKPRAALCVDGMDLDLKERLTAQRGLTPLPHRLHEIYSYARKHVSVKWWRYYYGAEPYCFWRRNRQRRYGTIFLNRST